MSVMSVSQGLSRNDTSFLLLQGDSVGLVTGNTHLSCATSLGYFLSYLFADLCLHKAIRGDNGVTAP